MDGDYFELAIGRHISPVIALLPKRSAAFQRILSFFEQLGINAQIAI